MEIGLRPLFTRLLIRRNVIKKVGSIIIAETSQEAKVGVGEVIAVGEDCERAKAGDVVLFGRYAPYALNKQELSWAGIEVIEDKDVEYLICNEEDLLAIKIANKKEKNNVRRGRG